MFARIQCEVSRERIQHSPTCPRLAFSHNSISMLVKQRGWFHTACLIPATVPITKTQISVWLHTSYKGYKIQVKSYRSQWRGHQEGFVKCVKYKKIIQTTGNHRGRSHSWQADKSFQYITIQTESKKKKKKTSHCTLAKYLHSFTLWYTHSSFPPPSISLPYIMAFCQWIYIFFCFPCNLPHFSSLVDGKSSSVMDWDADSQRSPDSCHGNSWIMTEYPLAPHPSILLSF